MLSSHPADDHTHARRAEFPLEFFQRVEIDQVITTDSLQQPNAKTSFGPDDQIHCYTVNLVGCGFRGAVHRTLYAQEEGRAPNSQKDTDDR